MSPPVYKLPESSADLANAAARLMFRAVLEAIHGKISQPELQEDSAQLSAIQQSDVVVMVVLEALRDACATSEGQCGCKASFGHVRPRVNLRPSETQGWAMLTTFHSRRDHTCERRGIPPTLPGNEFQVDFDLYIDDGSGLSRPTVVWSEPQRALTGFKLGFLRDLIEKEVQAGFAPHTIAVVRQIPVNTELEQFRSYLAEDANSVISGFVQRYDESVLGDRQTLSAYASAKNALRDLSN